jgi:hypothetical protein
MFLLRFILIFILVVIVFRLLGRLFLFSVVKNFNNKMNSDQYTNRRKEGDIIVDANNISKKKKIKKDIGDYVNYEEVD